MRTNRLRAANPPAPSACAWAMILSLAAAPLSGCGGGGGSSSGSGSTSPQTQTTTWRTSAAQSLELGGLTSPWVRAATAADGTIDVVYFEDAGGAPAPYRIAHLELAADGPRAADAAAADTVAYVDNCAGLALTPVAGHGPAVLYQGGVPRSCGAELQSDLMLSVTGDGGWQEHTAAIGDNPRNPTFQDGLAGTQVAAATAADGSIHAVYQFYYEGCDAMNFRYPDLRYVRFTPRNPSLPSEETVEGNDYDTDNVQNRAGDHAAIVLDDDTPVVFYEATLTDGSHGLRVARRGEDGRWNAQWVETDSEIAHISAATAPAGGVAVAYYVTRTTDHRDDVNCLRFAEFSDGGWVVRTVDETSRCGAYCSLAFDSAGDAAVVYRALETHSGYPLQDLMLARRVEGTWVREILAATGDLGHFNSAWFGNEDQLLIVTYSAQQGIIYLVEEVVGDAP